MPLVTPEKAAEQWRLFEALKAKLLGTKDYQNIAGKRYIKRSGFRKIAVYFGISDRILKEQRTEREDGSFFWRIEVEAFAPNGRSCVGVGACDSKERRFAHAEHDVYATAHTRAKSRAISDLVAGGAVSAEEIDVSSTDENAPTTGPENKSTSIDAQTKPSKVPTTKEAITMEGLRQFPLTDGLKAVGMVNVLGDELSIVPENPLKIEGSTISNFLLPRVLDPLVTKHNLSYTVMKNESGDLAYIIVVGEISEKIIKDLQTPARWAFAKAMEQDQKKIA
jgi:hypothetical protein